MREDAPMPTGPKRTFSTRAPVWWALLVAGLVAGLLHVVLLSGVPGRNPTGRYLSSQMPRTSGEGRAADLGADGERILARDLRLPNNNDFAQRQCVCGAQFTGSPPPRDCRVCVVTSPQVQNYRLPDFVGQGFIVEAKNAREVGVDPAQRDTQQLLEMAAAALAMGQPLWVYVRVNSVVGAEVTRAVRATGGGVVHYYRVAGVVHPRQRAARQGLAASIVTAGVGMAGLWLGRRRELVPVVTPPMDPYDTLSPRPEDDPAQVDDQLRARRARLMQDGQLPPPPDGPTAN